MRTDTRLYSIWENMKTRCYNKNTPKYQIYGARGIQVCKAWKESYNAFYDWAMAHGYQTSLTLDRIDPNGNYEPSNCRWASHTEQACNKRNARQIFYQGKLWNLSELSKKTDIPSSTLYEKSEEEIKDLLEMLDSYEKREFIGIMRGAKMVKAFQTAKQEAAAV